MSQKTIRTALSDNDEQLALTAFGRQLYYDPPRTEADVTLAMKEYAAIRKGIPFHQSEHVAGMKPLLKDGWFRAAQRFLADPRPILDPEALVRE